VCPGQGERQEHHVAGHVGDKDVAKDEIAERIHQARDHGHGYQQRWQRAVLAAAVRNDHLADLRGKTFIGQHSCDHAGQPASWLAGGVVRLGGSVVSISVT
jgi:hypothetical protein